MATFIDVSQTLGDWDDRVMMWWSIRFASFQVLHVAANHELLDMPGCKEVSDSQVYTLSWSGTLSGQCCQLSDKLEDKPFPRAQGEWGEHPQGRGRGQAVPCRAGKVSHNGRVSEEAVRVSEADSQDLRDLGDVLEGSLGGRGGPARTLQGRGRSLELSLQVKRVWAWVTQIILYFQIQAFVHRSLLGCGNRRGQLHWQHEGQAKR